MFVIKWKSKQLFFVNSCHCHRTNTNSNQERLQARTAITDLRNLNLSKQRSPKRQAERKSDTVLFTRLVSCFCLKPRVNNVLSESVYSSVKIPPQTP